MGLRPSIAQGGGKSARVMRVEHLSDQTRLHLKLEGHDITTLTDVHTGLQGDHLPVTPRNPLFFDINGARIAQGRLTVRQFINEKDLWLPMRLTEHC